MQSQPSSLEIAAYPVFARIIINDSKHDAAPCFDSYWMGQEILIEGKCCGGDPCSHRVAIISAGVKVPPSAGPVILPKPQSNPGRYSSVVGKKAILRSIPEKKQVTEPPRLKWIEFSPSEIRSRWGLDVHAYRVNDGGRPTTNGLLDYCNPVRHLQRLKYIDPAINYTIEKPEEVTSVWEIALRRSDTVGIEQLLQAGCDPEDCQIDNSDSYRLVQDISALLRWESLCNSASVSAPIDPSNVSPCSALECHPHNLTLAECFSNCPKDFQNIIRYLVLLYILPNDDWNLEFLFDENRPYWTESPVGMLCFQPTLSHLESVLSLSSMCGPKNLIWMRISGFLARLWLQNIK